MAAGAVVGGCVALGRGVVVERGAHIERSVILDGVRVGAHTGSAPRSSGPQAVIGEHCHLDGGVVLGEGVQLGAHNTLRAGARLSPGTSLPEGAVRF